MHEVTHAHTSLKQLVLITPLGQFVECSDTLCHWQKHAQVLLTIKRTHVVHITINTCKILNTKHASWYFAIKLNIYHLWYILQRFQMLCLNISHIICLEHFDIRGRMSQVFNSFSENTCSILWNTLPLNQITKYAYLFSNFSVNINTCNVPIILLY